MATTRLDLQSPIGQFMNLPGRGFMLGIGSGAQYQVTANTIGGIAGNPINGEVGFSPGALFINPETAISGNYLWTNVGTNTSALWRQLIGSIGGFADLASETFTVGSVTSTFTIPAANTLFAQLSDLVITGSATGTGAPTLDTTAHLIAQVPGVEVNDAVRLRIMNNTSVTLTLTAGDASTNVQGAASIAALAWRDFDFLFNTVTGSGSITVTNAGAGTYHT